MYSFFLQYQLLVDAALLAVLLALSQFVVLKAGVFSVAPVGLAAISAYTTAELQLRYHLGSTVSLAGGVAAAVLVAVLLALPLARLRGIFQAIATLSFVIVVQSAILIFNGVTGGASGLNGIPKTQSTGSLLLVVAATVALLGWLGRGATGQVFDALRQDEIAAASHGVSVFRYQTYAFTLSGLIAGVAGGVMANYSYSVVPEQFGFQVVVSTLTYVVIGGVARLGGALVGTAFLMALPEIIRPVADQRLVINGVLLILVSIFLPSGVVDGAVNRYRNRRAATRPSARAGGAGGAGGAGPAGSAPGTVPEGSWRPTAAVGPNTPGGRR